MNYLFLLTLLFLKSNLLLAKELLLPMPKVTFEQYNRKCQNNYYICSHQYFYNNILEHKTNTFDKLIDELDMQTIDYEKKFKSQIVSILKVETLSLSQINHAIDILNFYDQKKPTAYFKMLANDLNYLIRIVQKYQLPTDSSNANYYVLFKNKISPLDLSLLKTNIASVPVYKIAYNKVPVKIYSKTSLIQPAQNQFIVDGTCNNFHLNLKIPFKNWSVFKNPECFK